MAMVRTDTAGRGRATCSSSWLSSSSSSGSQPAEAADAAGSAGRPGKTNPDARAAARSSPAAAAAAAAGRQHVLIIEDDQTHASALRSILTRKGHDVAIAATLADGIASLESSRPDFIVLDLMLPDGDGVEVLRLVRALERAAAPRVIVTTAVGDTDRLREVLALGPHRLLRKPFDLIDLLGAIGMM